MFIASVLVAAIGLLWLIWLVGNERFWAAFWLLVVPAALIGYASWDTVFAFFRELSPVIAVSAVLGYLAVGYGTALIKWTIRSKNVADYVKLNKQKFLGDGDPFSKNLRYSMGSRAEGLELKSENGQLKLIRSEDFGNVIRAWVIWWPFVLLWVVFDDFLRNIINILTDWMGGVFQSITDSFMKD